MDFADILTARSRLSGELARELSQNLLTVWNVQCPSMRAPQRTLSEMADFAHLEADLGSLHHWFNPVASGKRLRDSIEMLEPATVPLSLDPGDLVELVDGHRTLVTPEGRVVMWLVCDALRSRVDELNDDLWLDPAATARAWSALTATYRVWNRQRLRSVTGLLSRETATLRPTAAGLLLVLLINRNTSPERQLPIPDDPTKSEHLSAALALPVLAFANGLSDSDSANARGLDLYRGWAMGEIARRLGGALHKPGHGIWVDDLPAEDRLVEALQGRGADQRKNLHAALRATRDAYDAARPVLVGLGIAHERPSVTARLFERLEKSLVVPERGPSQ